MTEKKKSTLSLSTRTGTKKVGTVRQSFSHGKTNEVMVEVKRRRTYGNEPAIAPEIEEVEEPVVQEAAPAPAEVDEKGLTPAEIEARRRALEDAEKGGDEKAEQPAQRRKTSRINELMQDLEEAEKEAEKRKEEEKPKKKFADPAPGFDDAKKTKKKEEKPKKPAPSSRGADQRRRSGKLTIAQALSGDAGREKVPSLSAMRRQQEKKRIAQLKEQGIDPTQKKEKVKLVREVVIPETITVQELANRMSEKGTEVIKALIKMGVMVTINQPLDGDTAEIIVEEFGHKPKRISDADIEIGLKDIEDAPETLKERPPVVTIMGHVDHGKTSLLDALRQTDVVSGEAGGITQHIGAYQVMRPSGKKITFVDTPGHAAFAEMRARGANVTDIVVLVVAADDGVKPQTIEAISHAKMAEVPIVVAINKIDKPEANSTQVKNELLQHEIVLEEMGGDVISVEVSAKQKTGLEELEESILLQAEILDLKANPSRAAQGTVIEARMEQGRGSVATVLVQHGTVKVGDIFVSGSEWGRVRAMNNDKLKSIKKAAPSMPVEITGINGTPLAGDDFLVVDSEAKARQIAEFRQRMKKNARNAIKVGNPVAEGDEEGEVSALEQMMAKKAEDGKTKLPVIVKAEVQGSVEAIKVSLEKLSNDEIEVQIIHSAAGGINETDINLAKSSGALVIGFNVRANPQARDLAKRDGIDIRYYSIIYNVVDDVKAALTGMLSPIIREEFIGNVEIRQVFKITKVGKVAGCMVVEGMVKRGAKVRLLRDNVVIHEGKLKTLKRFQDEVKEVKEGTECGMAFENYDDMKEGDIIECFEVIEEAGKL